MTSLESDSVAIHAGSPGPSDTQTMAKPEPDRSDVVRGSKRQASLTEMFAVIKRARVDTPKESPEPEMEPETREEDIDRDGRSPSAERQKPTSAPSHSPSATPGVPQSPTETKAKSTPAVSVSHDDDSDDVQIVGASSKEAAKADIPVIDLEDSDSEQNESVKPPKMTLEEATATIAELRDEIAELRVKRKEAVLRGNKLLREGDAKADKLQTKLLLCQQVETHKIPWNAANERQRQSQVKCAVDVMKEIVEKRWRKRLIDQKHSAVEKLVRADEEKEELKEKHQLALKKVREDGKQKFRDLQAKQKAHMSQERNAVEKLKDTHAEEIRGLKAKMKAEGNTLRQRVRDTEAEQRQATKSLKPAHSAAVLERDQQIDEQKLEICSLKKEIERLEAELQTRKDRVNGALDQLGESESALELARKDNRRLCRETAQQLQQVQTWKVKIKEEQERWEMQQIRFDDCQRQLGLLRQENDELRSELHRSENVEEGGVAGEEC